MYIRVRTHGSERGSVCPVLVLVLLCLCLGFHRVLHGDVVGQVADVVARAAEVRLARVRLRVNLRGRRVAALEVVLVSVLPELGTCWVRDYNMIGFIIMCE